MRDNIKGVAFDLDGTLYPNYRLHFRLLPFALKEFRLLSAFGRARNIIREEMEQKFRNGHSDSGQLLVQEGGFYAYQAEKTAKLLSVKSDQLKEKIDRLIYNGWTPIFKKVKVFKEVPHTLETLRKAGLKLGLLSDFPPEEKLKNLGIDGYWDCIHCSERCGALKPYPLSFQKLALAMELPPENILYVGNSHPYDVIGAARAGMKTAWIKPVLSPGKKPAPDFSFTNYRQFLKFMIL